MPLSLPGSTEAKVAAVFGIASLTVGTLCIAFYLITREAAQSHEQVANTDEVLLVLGRTLAKVTEAETGQRGYVLTGNEEYLEPYRAAVAVLDNEVRRLRQLTADNPSQREALNRLEPLIAERLARIKTAVDLRNREGFEAARQFIETRKGVEIMNEIRQLVTRIGEAEQGVLERRYQRTRRRSVYTLMVFSVLAVGNFGLLFTVYLVVRNDLGRRRHTQAQLADLVRRLEGANRELQDFAHVVSHDLKAPLRGVANLALFLANDYGPKLDEPGRQQLQLISNRINRMHNLIEGILDYSKLTRTVEEKTSLAVAPLLREVIDLLAPPPHIRVELVGVMPTVQAPRTRLQQVFQNLIGNAVKFNDKETGIVQVRCHDAGNAWTFSVSDNGPGIEEKYFVKIFQMFQTLARRDEQENTGIGLAMVKKIVEAWGGQIWVESKPGHGSTFFFSLPKN